jgi:anti-sigma regulatory factor (Ser/Thr protein kinase)
MDTPCPPGDKQLQLRLPSRPDSIGIVRACVGAFVRSHGLSNADEIVVAACHMSANAVLHAFRSPQDEPEFEVEAQFDDGCVRLEITEHLADGVPSLGVDLALVERVADDVRVTTPAHGERVVHARFERSRRLAV